MIPALYVKSRNIQHCTHDNGWSSEIPFINRLPGLLTVPFRSSFTFYRYTGREGTGKTDKAQMIGRIVLAVLGLKMPTYWIRNLLREYKKYPCRGAGWYVDNGFDILGTKCSLSNLDLTSTCSGPAGIKHR